MSTSLDIVMCFGKCFRYSMMMPAKLNLKISSQNYTGVDNNSGVTTRSLSKNIYRDPCDSAFKFSSGRDLSLLNPFPNKSSAPVASL